MTHMIVNPVAGHGQAARLAEDAGRMLDSLAIAYTRVDTLSPGHGAALAREALERGATRIICVGGDGTAREVASALMGSECVFSVVPCGTGNDFVKTLGLPREPISALKTQLAATPRRIDACTVSGQVFINAAGAGFDAEVVRYTQRYKARVGGMLAYLLGVLRALFDARAHDMNLIIDGIPSRRRLMLATVANGRYIGGGMRAAPLADPADGLFDVMLTCEVTRFQILRLLPKFIDGSYLSLRFVERVTCKTIAISCPGMCLQVDGELMQMNEALFEIHPGALWVTAGDYRPK